MSELKPCPFCEGGFEEPRSTHANDGDKYLVHVAGPEGCIIDNLCVFLKDQTELWNRRPPAIDRDRERVDALWEQVHEWCGSAYCMADDEHSDGVCACDTSRGSTSFDCTNMVPCTIAHCPLMSRIRAALSDSPPKGDTK